MKAFILAALVAVLSAVCGVAMADPIRGSGSTFAFPVIAKWSAGYQAEQAGGYDSVADNGVDYEPVGSLGGILRLANPEIDFAASDAPLPPDELKKFGYVQFPLVMGGIAVVVNLDGIEPGALKLTGALLADIYLGRIQNWSDPAIQAVNAGLALPDMKITAVHRADGSGSTFTLTQYLSASSEEWKTKYGADTLISWPLGTDAEASSGMIAAVKATKGAIGYVEFGQVARAGLNYVSLQNKAGQFVKPERAAFEAAAAGADWASTTDFHLSLIDAPGEAAYPVAAVTFVLMPAEPRSSSRLNQALWFFSYALDKGASEAAALGYVPVPAPLVGQVKAYWRDKFKFES